MAPVVHQLEKDLVYLARELTDVCRITAGEHGAFRRRIFCKECLFIVDAGMDGMPEHCAQTQANQWPKRQDRPVVAQEAPVEHRR